MPARPASADLVFTLFESGDGGISLIGKGTSTGAFSFDDNAVQFFFDFGILPIGFGLVPVSGETISVGGVEYEATEVFLDSSDGFNTPNTFIQVSTVNTITSTGPVAIDEISVSFPVSNFAFADATPGTFASTSLAGVSLTVVPEPSSLALLVLGSSTLIRRRRHD